MVNALREGARSACRRANPVPAALPWVNAFLTAATVFPVVFIALAGQELIRNSPMWDEFSTVLDFLVRVRDAPDFGALWRIVFEPSLEHRTVTSRLITLAAYGLTGEVNFIHLAIAGNLSICAAIGILAWRQDAPPARRLLVAVMSLLVFQMLHYENLFSSYASIDHFLVVALALGTLALLASRSWLATIAAIGMGGLATHTLAHGLAVIPAGMVLLASGRRWGHLAAWTVCGAALAAFYLDGLWDAVLPSAGSTLSLTSAARMGRFWLETVGGVPTVGNAAYASLAGAAALMGFGWLVARRAWREDPFLFAVAVNSLLATLLIAYGRSQMDIPALSSRYMIQSAMFWGPFAIIALKTGPVPFSPAVLAGVAGAGIVLNVASNIAHEGMATHFARHRIAAVRHYDVHNTLTTAPTTIHPDARLADRVLQRAALRGIFRLGPRRSPRVPFGNRAEERAMLYHIDQLMVTGRNIHVRGWVLPPDGTSEPLRPLAIFELDGRTHAFRGFPEARPDVAATYDRPGALESGFYFVIPRSALGAGAARLKLGLRGNGRTFFTNTDHVAILDKPLLLPAGARTAATEP